MNNDESRETVAVVKRAISPATYRLMGGSINFRRAKSMKRKTSSNSPSKAFTLIELLTVIAIIGILAAILIPVVGKVRDSARASVCVSNVRQMMTAMLIFAEEHEGRFPAPQDESRHNGPNADLPQGVNTWHAYIAPYAGFDHSVRIMYDNDIHWRSNSAEMTVFHCPTTVDNLVPLPNFGGGARLNPHYSYGLNAEMPAAAGMGGRRSGNNISAGDLHAPTQTMAIMETSDWSATYSREIGGPNGTGQALVPHNGMNVGMYDGSVRRLTIQELLEIPADSDFWRGGLQN